MIANRGLHRSQPIWITLHRSTVPLRIVHDRFSRSASSSLSFSLIFSLSLSPLFISSDRFGIRSQPIPRSSELCYAVWRRTLRKRSVIHEEQTGPNNFWIRLVGVFARGTGIPSPVSSPPVDGIYGLWKSFINSFWMDAEWFLHSYVVTYRKVLYLSSH